MASPDYTDIAQFVELRDVQAVNTHLQLGWCLLNLRTVSTADVPQETIYVLGLPCWALPSSATTDGSRAVSTRIPDALPASPTQSTPQEGVTPGLSHTDAAEHSLQPIHPNRRGAGARQQSQVPPRPQSAKPITLVTRIQLPESATGKRRRRKEPLPAPPREPTEQELRERAAWQQVQETSKPVLFEDKLLIPEGMSAWEAIEFLPDGLREQTREAMQHRVCEAYFGAVRHMRERLLEKTGDDGAKERYHSFSYPAQMRSPETIVRQQLEMPELPMRELLERYGVLIQNENERDSE